MFKTYLEIGQIDDGKWGMVLHKESLFNDKETADPNAIINLADQLRRLSAAFDEMEVQVRGEAADGV